jgi:archaemetzincin
MASVCVVPIDVDPAPWIEELEKGIRRCFGSFTRIHRLPVSLDRTFDMKRLQYNSSQILLQLLPHAPGDGTKILGVVDVDLFIPVLTFVFGEAQLRGDCAVVAMHRLNNRFYGLPDDPALLTERLVKEALHELGHNFGLIHCVNPECVMRSSTYVEEIDQKSAELCDRCREQLA